MQNTPRKNRFGIDLSSIQQFPRNTSYVQQVVDHLRNTKQNLSTKDLAILFSDDLQMSFRTMYTQNFEMAVLIQISNPHGLYNAGDVYNMQRLICDNLPVDIGFDVYYQNLLTIKIDLPSQSTLNPKKLAVWRNTSKMGGIETRQAVSVRKWIGSTLVGLTDEQAENLACKIDKFLQGETLANLDVRHHNSYEFDAWERAYVNDAILSCMNPLHTSSEVGRKRTFTTYCSGYHGLPDNGLNLTVLYQKGEPVARAITFKNGEQDCYIKTYGDDRLHKWLMAKGYEQSDFPSGTFLYTTADLMKPYVDGKKVHFSDHYINSDGKHYWLLSDEGEYDLQTTDAFAYPQSECECCGNLFSDAALGEYRSAVDGDWYMVCDSCYEDNRYWVYTGGRHSEPLFFHDGYSPDTNDDYIEYDGEYYHVDSLSEYDLRMIDGEVYHVDDLYYCEFTSEYFTCDGVYTDANEISTTQPVYFPYDCVSKQYWDNNVVECACGTLAVECATTELGKPSLGDVVTLDAYWSIYRQYNGAGVEIIQTIFNIDEIECDYDLYETEQMQAFLDYAKAYNTIQYLRFQELGI